MRNKKQTVVTVALIAIVCLAQCHKNNPRPQHPDDPALIHDGTQIFRFDTFGDEDFWTSLLSNNESTR